MKTALVLTVLALPYLALAQTETCDRFSFAVSKTKLETLPVTVLRGGLSPVLEIAGKPYAYDVATHCLSEAGLKASTDCAKPLKVMDGKKVVALIEGQGKVSISPVDEKGKRDVSQPSYSVFVARDVSAPARPRFVVEAIGADGKVLGRIDGVEGMTSSELTHFKGKLASAHGLIDLRGKDLVYANCRKLAVMHYDDSKLSMMRMIASARKETAGTPSKSVPFGGSNGVRAMASTPHFTKFNSTENASIAAPVGSFAPPPPVGSFAPPPSSFDRNMPMAPPPPPSYNDPMNPSKR